MSLYLTDLSLSRKLLRSVNEFNLFFVGPIFQTAILIWKIQLMLVSLKILFFLRININHTEMTVDYYEARCHRR